MSSVSQREGMGIAGDLALIVVVALVGGLAAQLLRLPLVLGYIVAGIIVGPHTAGPTVTQVHDIEVLADLGVAFLLFTVGLEFSPARLKPMGLITFVGTPLQILLTAGFGYALAALWGISSPLWFACLISLSSTMVTLKLLIDQGYSKALSGRVMLAMLVVQDLAAIPMMIVLPGGSGGGSLAVALLKAALLVGSMLLFGARILPALLGRVLRTGSHELFLVTVLGVALGVGTLSHLCGLSFALGAFLAGLVLSESEYSHQAMGTVGPFRDLFGMIFFVSVGMLIEPEFLRAHLAEVLGLVAVVMTGKGLIFALVVRSFGYRKVIPFAVAFGLSQVGEFSFVLARAGLQGGGLDRPTYDLVLVLAVLSMALTPFLFRLSRPTYLLWRRLRPEPPVTATQEPVEEYQDHLIVAGYGKVGRHVARLLQEAGRSFVVCELDWGRYSEARAAGMEAVFGDFTSSAVLEAVHIDRARRLLVTTRNAIATDVALREARRCNPGIALSALYGSDEEKTRLEALGVNAVWPEREGASTLVWSALEPPPAGSPESIAGTGDARS